MRNNSLNLKLDVKKKFKSQRFIIISQNYLQKMLINPLSK